MPEQERPGREHLTPEEKDRSLKIALPCSEGIEVPSGQPAQREVGQVTLSTIGDVGLAAEDIAKRLAASPRRLRILPIVGCFFLLYLLSAAVGLYTLKSAPWVRVFVAPLAVVAVATGIFAWLERWKARAREIRFKLRVWEGALGSLGHQAANSVNAVRANLIGFRDAYPECRQDEHLAEIESAVQRLAVVVQQSARPMASQAEARR